MKYDIKTLTLEEKLSLLVGGGNMHTSDANAKLPVVYVADGPLGLRSHQNYPNRPRIVNMATGIENPFVEPTAMPALHVLCNSWDPELVARNASSIADDCIDNGVDVLLAPGVNIKRSPLCGRNFEYFSEDPYLAGTMAKAYIEGVQGTGLGTSLKHFCANNSEYDRNAISSEIDERTLREIYLAPFEIALQAKPTTVMCSYNLINGVYASENGYLLSEILRGEFGFDGLIVSDWGATHNAVRAAQATLDLTMPYAPEHIEALRAGYENGELTEAQIDERAGKVLGLIEKTKIERRATTTKPERHDIAVKAAKESIVLLKNEENILPLTGGKLLVAGLFGKLPPYGGGGSSKVPTSYQPAPLTELLSARLGERAELSYALAHDYGALGSSTQYATKVYQKAYGADVTLLCVGTNPQLEFEGGDREHLRLPQVYEDMILRTAKATENLVVIVYAGSAIDMSAWIDKVKAVVFVGFAGEGGNEALADILTGAACPCGKLSETFPLCLEDAPTGTKRGGNGFVDRYTEGVFVGYRWYDETEKEVLFPFGHGLSYAKFEYSDLTVTKTGVAEYEVSYTVKNLSAVDGKEISQVYVRDVFAAVSRPKKELKGYSKDLIKAGESKRITVKLDYRSFAYYSTALKKWHVENGEFEILVGASSQDLPLKAKILIDDAPDQYSKPY